MDCPECFSNVYVKSGSAKGKPRYKCKSCNYQYTVKYKSTAKLPETRRLALKMYLEGMGFRQMGRVLEISHITVYRWIKELGSISLPRTSTPAKVVEIDEMHTFVGKKKNYKWIWIAVDRFGKRFIDFVCGDRSTATGSKLWDKIKHLQVNSYATDYWRSYEEFLPPEKHIQSKKETYTVESYNSRVRHYLARFKRKTKCYSKSMEMIEISLKLLMMKLNNDICILA